MLRTEVKAPFVQVATVVKTKGTHGELLVRMVPGASLLINDPRTYYLAPPFLEHKTLHVTKESCSSSAGDASSRRALRAESSHPQIQQQHKESSRVVGSHPDASTDLVRLRFAEVDDRQKAHEALGRALLVKTAELSDAELAMLDSGQDVLFPELGYDVTSDEGVALGTITDQIETGANLVWVVTGQAGDPKSEILLPVITDLQIQRDDEHKCVTVHLLDGLLEVNR